MSEVTYYPGAIRIQRLRWIEQQDSRIDPVPVRATVGASGLDLRAAVGEPVVLWPGEQAMVPTGVALAIPRGMVGQLVPRSSLGRNGLALANTLGIIDPDYRGEVLAALWHRGNLEGAPIVIAPGMRIAQLVVVACPMLGLEVVADLDVTARGAGGFGSTGVA